MLQPLNFFYREKTVTYNFNLKTDHCVLVTLYSHQYGMFLNVTCNVIIFMLS